MLSSLQEYVSLKAYELVASSKGELERTRRYACMYVCGGGGRRNTPCRIFSGCLSAVVSPTAGGVDDLGGVGVDAGVRVDVGVCVCVCVLRWCLVVVRCVGVGVGVGVFA